MKYTQYAKHVVARGMYGMPLELLKSIMNVEAVAVDSVLATCTISNHSQWLAIDSIHSLGAAAPAVYGM